MGDRKYCWEILRKKGRKCWKGKLAQPNRRKNAILDLRAVLNLVCKRVSRCFGDLFRGESGIKCRGSEEDPDYAGTILCSWVFNINFWINRIPWNLTAPAKNKKKGVRKYCREITLPFVCVSTKISPKLWPKNSRSSRPLASFPTCPRNLPDTLLPESFASWISIYKKYLYDFFWDRFEWTFGSPKSLLTKCSTLSINSRFLDRTQFGWWNYSSWYLFIAQWDRIYLG